MSNTNTNASERFAAIMDKRGFNRHAAAAILDVSPFTVASWLRTKGTAGHNYPPEMAIELLSRFKKPKKGEQWMP